MNFDFQEKEEALGRMIKEVFDQDQEAGTALARLEHADSKELRDATLRCLKALGETGYLELGLEQGTNSVALTAAQESLAALSPSLFLSVEVHARLFGRLVAVYGTDDQKAEILPSLKQGRVIGAVAMSEDGMSIDNQPLETMAVSRGDGFHLSGSKGHVVNAPVSDWIAVAGTVQGKAGEGVAFFLVKKESEGFSLGRRLPTIGYHGTAISAVMLENCPVPSRFVIEGEELLRSIRMWEDQILTAAGLGLMQRSYEIALKYAKEHMRGGKPIIAFQEIGFKLAEMLTLLQTAQLLAFRSAWMSETGDREADVLVRCAKVFCAESAEEVSSQALQILGGQGYLSGNPAEEGYRNAKYLEIAGASMEISRMKIAESVLGET